MSPFRTLSLAALIALFLVSCGGGSVGSTGDADVATDGAVETEVSVDVVQEIPEVEPEKVGCQEDCCSDDDCDDSDACTTDQCLQNSCVHESIGCDDGNPCTTDACDPETGCTYESIAGCCIPGSVDDVYVLNFEDETLVGDLVVHAFGADSDTPASWQLDTLKYHSASHAYNFGIPGQGSYENGARVAASFETPVIAVPGGRKAELSFWLWMNVEASLERDLFSVSVLVGSGDETKRIPIFEKLADVNDQVWHPITVDLTAFAGGDIRLEFAFDSVDDQGNNYNGVYLDDLVVSSICEDATCATIPGCDDGLPCTAGTCAGDTCEFVFDDACCANALDCRDENACMIDSCVDGACVWTPSPDALCCNDDAGCEDDDACTIDSCVNDRCVYVPSGQAGCCVADADCDDEDSCTIDSCVDGACVLENTCCQADLDCDDGDDVCTVEHCIEGACVYEATGVEGCCDPALLAMDFESGAGDISFDNSDENVGWHVFGGEGNSSAPTRALYYGDSSDPTNLNYDNDGINNGSAKIPLSFGPVGTAAILTFDAFFDTEASPDFDTLTVYVVLGDERYLVWDKSQFDSVGAWSSYQVDLSGFAGNIGVLEFAFDTVDNTINYNEGVYVDNVAVASSCVARSCATDPDCDDGLAVTDESCVAELCEYGLKDRPCDYDFECDDDQVCTSDACVVGYCEHQNIDSCCVEDLACDDANLCTEDSCQENVCVNDWQGDCCVTSDDCVDSSPCTVDLCSAEGESCVHEWTPGCCMINDDCEDDDNTTQDVCTAAGCVHKPAICAVSSDCADTDPCTDDLCEDGLCYYLPVNSGGCCEPVLFSANFDDGDLGAFTVENSSSTTGWLLSSEQANSSPYALGYAIPELSAVEGEADPGTSGRLTSAPLHLPANSGLSVAFALYVDVQAEAFMEPLEVLLVTDLGEQPVWGYDDTTGVAGAWFDESFDLTPYAGQTVQLVFAFATGIAPEGGGDGIFIDDIRVSTTCNPWNCSTDGDCVAFDACTRGSCAGGFCLFAPDPECCSIDEECDDANACTVDFCPIEGGSCRYDWTDGCCLEDSQCEDANPCTIQSCGAGAEDGSCIFEWIESCCLVNDDCDDGQGATLDLCVAGSCVSKPAGCEADADCVDGDACTQGACHSGICVWLPIATEACCQEILVDARFDDGATSPFTVLADPDAVVQWQLSGVRYDSAPASLYFGQPGTNEGAICDDGWAFTGADSWTSDGCQGIVTEEPSIFRIYELGIAEPSLSYDFGEGEVAVNAIVSAFVTAQLGTAFEAGGVVAAFDPLRLGYDAGHVIVGEGDCSFDEEILTGCGLLADGKAADLYGVRFKAEGLCGGDAAVAAPCFESDETSFELSSLLPGVFPETVDTGVRGTAYGAFSGDPISGLSNTAIRAFVPRTVFENFDFQAELFGKVVTVIDVLDEAQMETYQGVEGWWVLMTLSASKTDFVSPGGCAADPVSCDDGDSCTVDSCNYRTGTCAYAAASDGGACDDGDDDTVLDRCDAGACVGFATAAPDVFRMSSLTLASPQLSYDLGEGPIAANGLLDAYMTSELEANPYGGMIVVFENLGYANDAMFFGDGHCEFEEGVAVACAPALAGNQASLDVVDFVESGSCGGAADVSAPCYQTGEQLFDIGALMGADDGFALDVGEVFGHSYGRFVGAPTFTGVISASFEAFFPRAVLASIEVELGGGTMTVDELFSDAPLETRDGVEGYVVNLAYEAGRVALLDLPSSCANDLTRCDDGDPLTADVCNVGGDHCDHLPLPSVAPQGSYDSGSATKGSVRSAPITLPLSSELSLGFSLFIDTEVGAERDPLLVRVLGDAGPLTVWDKDALGAEDYGTWSLQSADLSAFQGQSVQVEFVFDSEDAFLNDGEGVYIDNVRVTTSCAPKACEDVVDCPAPDACTDALCADGLCLFASTPDCCTQEEDCDDANVCTTETCVDTQCQHEVVEGCCNVNVDCDDGVLCTIDTCTADHDCVYAFDSGCSSPLPYIQGFDVQSFEDVGWTTAITGGTGSTNWDLSGASDGMDAHVEFGYSPVVQDYEHWLISPLLTAPEDAKVTLHWQAFFEGYGAADTVTTCSLQVSNDGGTTWASVWSEDYGSDDAPLAGKDIDITDLVGGPAARVAFVIAGENSYDIMAWHVDDLRVLTGSAPILDPILEQTANVGEITQVLFNVYELDEGQDVTVSLPTSTPDFVTLVDKEGGLYAIQVQPTVEDLGDHEITIFATDGQFVVSTSFTLHVESSKTLLVETFDVAPDLATAGWTIDIDGDGTVPHWAIAELGAINGSPSAEFGWYPTALDYSEWLISPLFDAGSAAGQSAQFLFTHLLDVSSLTDINLTAFVSNDDGSSWTPVWTRSFDDLDKDIGPESVMVDVGAALAGTPTGRVAFRIQGDTSYALASWLIDDVRVIVGAAPSVSELPAQAAYIGATTDIALHASDGDGDALSFALVDPPAFVTIEALSDEAAVIHVTNPTAADWGTLALTYTVSDGSFLVTETLEIVIQYPGENLLLQENFDALADLDAGGWSVRFDANEETGAHWGIVETGSVDGSPAARFNWTPSVSNYGEWLVSPVIDAAATAGDEVRLSFAHKLDIDSQTDVTLAVMVSADSGETWSEAWVLPLNDANGSDDVGPETRVVDVSLWLAGAENARVAFRITGSDSYALQSWQVDDVLVLGFDKG